ncbi:MAG: septal ring lytic transglycosylase RlpA family protein [Candidatus Cloacimonadales bacterium]|jgi:rare lipoprotein A|nr:septal ring lytic transglycosylase RlpA family protein [Candidatus Cloacimonadota bacterium]MDD2650250.1 septal ring lytic transglycosylase RlpA family protein [Candidatus Cloacimonadota bacterium]MDD3501993.1 septal ring lytic transglycosylase RlpA family protein [Candidatus Cloacimonadota bacterium]MDX9978346.1 septal ring lytic transglycosylase RlpA family protein [Candidatus Cloacimonadales bacterium]
MKYINNKGALLILSILTLLLLNACSPAVIYSNSAASTTSSSTYKPKSSGTKSGWQTMTCSFYGDDFHGKYTANGEIFDMNMLTAAHKTLPFDTKLMIWDEDTDKKVTVRINDRGPFIAGRDLDLSKGAARQIGMIGAGVKKLKVKIIE